MLLLRFSGIGITKTVFVMGLKKRTVPATAGNGVVSQGTYDAATGLFDIGILNIGETATLTLEGTVDVGEGGNTITNVTTAAIGDQPDPSTIGDELGNRVIHHRHAQRRCRGKH